MEFWDGEGAVFDGGVVRGAMWVAVVAWEGGVRGDGGVERWEAGGRRRWAWYAVGVGTMCSL